MDRKYGQHGRRHVGTESDPIITDWHYVGGSGEASFQNGWGNFGGSSVPMRWRFLPSQDPLTAQAAVELQGAVTGGSDATVVFTLPITLDYDLHLAASDSSGSYVVFTVQQSGDVVFGFV